MSATARVLLTFWALVLIAVLATGALSRALTWSDGPIAGVTIALAGLIAIIAVLLAVRMMVVVAGRRPDGVRRTD